MNFQNINLKIGLDMSFWTIINQESPTSTVDNFFYTFGQSHNCTKTRGNIGHI